MFLILHLSLILYYIKEEMYDVILIAYIVLLELLENNFCRGKNNFFDCYTLSFCIPPAFATLITKTKETAFGRYSFSF